MATGHSKFGCIEIPLYWKKHAGGRSKRNSGCSVPWICFGPWYSEKCWETLKRLAEAQMSFSNFSFLSDVFRGGAETSSTNCVHLSYSLVYIYQGQFLQVQVIICFCCVDWLCHCWTNLTCFLFQLLNDTF